MCTILTQYIYLWPEIFLSLAASLVLMLGVFAKKYCFKGMNIVVGSFFAFSLYILIGKVSSEEIVFANGLFKNSPFIHNLKLIILSATLLFTLVYKGQNFTSSNKLKQFEFPVLILFSCVGMMLMLASNHFLSFYVALEFQSLCLYILAAFDRDDLKSSEAALKYFVLGSFASGILLFGISLIYGFTGNLNFEHLSLVSHNKEAIAIIIGIILVLIAMFFKSSAAPFHMWTPDVYQGSPTIVTSFFANIVKIASVGMLLRFCTEIIASWQINFQPIILLIAVFSSLTGAIGALMQENFKRLLAYSSIGHVGFMLLAIASFKLDSSVLTYLIIYVAMNLPVFMLIMSLKNNDTNIENISQLSGLSKTNPLLAFAMAVFMFSLAGIPPFSGFFAKFYIFQNAIVAKNYLSLIACVIAAIISAYYYLKIVKIMYFDEPKEVLILDVSNLSKVIIALLVMFNLLFILL